MCGLIIRAAATACLLSNVQRILKDVLTMCVCPASASVSDGDVDGITYPLASLVFLTSRLQNHFYVSEEKKKKKKLST